MNKIMTLIDRAALVTGAAMLFTLGASAQVTPATFPTTGTASINMEVPNSVQMSSYGTPAITGGNMSGSPVPSAGQSPAASGNPLNVTLTFGDVSTNNTTAAPYEYGSFGIRVRSNCPYIIRAARTGTLPDGAGNSGTLKTGDVGMAVFYVNAGGDPMSYPGAQNGTINGTTALGFYGGASSSVAAAFTPTVVAGQPTWTKSLKDIGASATNFIAGTRVSNGGDNSNYQNTLSLFVGFAVKPQYYTVSTSANNTALLTLDIIPAP